jgi:hypothetical protein
LRIVEERVFHHALGSAVRIDRLARVLFVHRHIARLAVHGGRGREDEAPHPVAHHRFEQIDRIAEVVAEILAGQRHRFLDAEERGEVHDGVEFLRAQHAIERGAVAEVAGFEVAAQHRVAIAGGEIVEHSHVVPAGEQKRDHV